MKEVSSGEVGNKKKKDEDKKEEVRDEDSSSSDSDSGSESDSSDSSATTVSSNTSSGSSSSQESDGGENDASIVNGHPSPSRAENGTSAVPVEAGVVPVETGVVPDESEEGDPTSSDSDDSDENDDEWAEVPSSSGEEQPDGAVDIHSNAAILQNAQSSLSDRSKKSELDPAMNRSVAMPNSSTVSVSSVKENDQISRANASGAAVSVLETPAPVSGVADATASAAATDANKKKRPPSPGSLSKSLGIDVLVAPKRSFRKPKVTEEKEPDNKRARLSEPEKSSNKKQTGADHSRSWSDTVSRQNGYQPHHPPQDAGDSFDDYNNFNYNGPVNQRPKWTDPDAVAQTGFSQMDLDTPYPDPRPQDRQKETDAATSTGTGRSRGYVKAGAQWGAQLMPGNKPRDDPTERLHGNRNNYDYQLSRYKNNFNRSSRDRRAGSREEGGREFRGHGSRDRERFERHKRAMSTQTDEKTVQKVDAFMQATTGWIEFCDARLDKSSVYKRKAVDKKQLGDKQPRDLLTTLRLNIEASVYYIQEAFAMEVEKADVTYVLSKLANVLKFCKENDASIKKRVAQDDPDMPWTILLVLNTRIISYVSKKLYLIRQQEMDDAKVVFDTYFMSGGSPSPTTSQISPTGSINSSESTPKSGNKDDKSDRMITAQIHKNLEIYIKYADYSRKSDQYYIRADNIVSKYPKVKQFYDNLEIQYREFLPIRPIEMFANYCLAAIASLANTEKS